MAKEKKRMIALDADYLIFTCTEGKHTKLSYFGAEEGSTRGKKYKEPLKPYKQKMKALIKDVEDEIAANMPGLVEGIKPIFSDPNGNFRYDIFPEYKAGRPPRSKLWYRLHKWALKKYGYTEGIEADDEVAYLVREEGWIGATMDKDLWRGIPGDWFNVYHSKRYMTYLSPVEARNFNLIQTLTGDRDDNIPGIPGVGETTAIKLLDKYGWHWEGVVMAYENADKPHPEDKRKRLSLGLTREDAIFARRLIGMDQWHPKHGVKIWQEPKRIEDE